MRVWLPAERNYLKRKKETYRYMKSIIKAFLLLAVCGMASACVDRDDDQTCDEDLFGADTQTFAVRVESIGEAQQLARAANESFINSITPVQTIDKVVVLVVNRADGRVVHKEAISGWSDTDNMASRPYFEGDRSGREADIVLRKCHRLKKGEEYIAYGVGYHEGTYGGYEPFKGVEVGDVLDRPETATKPDGELAAELFAGAQTFVNEGGRIVSRSMSADENEGAAAVTLRRQVGGTFGYFTRIPVEVGGVAVASVRMASPKAYKTIIMAGFRSQEDPDRFDAERVVNGADERTVYDAAMYGAGKDDAFMIYRIDLKNWFPGNEADPDLPLDMNGDGYLDASDGNWRLSPYLEGTGIKLARGTVYGSRYLIATAMDAQDILAGRPTFELQLLDKQGRILKHWPVEMRDEYRLTQPRTVVTLASDGKTVTTTTVYTPEAPLTYSILRNNLYTLGDKTSDQSYGEDTPIRLAEEDVLVMDVNPEWRAFDSIIFQ